MRLHCVVCLGVLLGLGCGRDSLNLQGANDRQDDGAGGSSQKQGAPEVTLIEPAEPNRQPMPSRDAAPGGPSNVMGCAAFANEPADRLKEFVALQWQARVDSCSSSFCWDWIDVKTGCSLSVQHKDKRQTGTMAPALCRDVQIMLTSQLLSDAIVACPEPPSAVDEAWIMMGPFPQRRKLFQCDNVHLLNARACLKQAAKTTLNVDL